jgi:hypothetical protein
MQVRSPWRRRLVRALVSVAVAFAVATVAFLGWLATGDAAEPVELDAALRDYAITVTDEGGVLTITPAGGPAEDALGVAFLPGTRVERDAYVATWAPIVETTGVIVHIAAVPLNLPALAGDPIGEIIAAHPETSSWIVGGHSMGGFEAAAFAAVSDTTPDGLLLWASGPKGSDLAGSEVPTLLVAGESDTVLPPDRLIDEELLAPDTTIEIIDGMVHGQFGRYSDTEDPLDATRRSDDETLADLVEATSAFIALVATAA